MFALDVSQINWRTTGRIYRRRTRQHPPASIRAHTASARMS